MLHLGLRFMHRLNPLHIPWQCWGVCSKALALTVQSLVYLHVRRSGDKIEVAETMAECIPILGVGASLEYSQIQTLLKGTSLMTYLGTTYELPCWQNFLVVFSPVLFPIQGNGIPKHAQICILATR